MGLVSRLGGALDDDDDDRPDAPLAATEGVAVMTQYWPFAFGYALLSPSVVVDGREQPTVGWGRIVIPAAPGPHHVAVHVPAFGNRGASEYTATVAADEFTEIVYNAPLSPSAAGALGPAPQPYHGNRLAVVVTMALLAATLLTAAVLVVLAMR